MAMSTKRISGEEAVHYIPPRKTRAKPKPRMQPPLTPMIDVTFQLLLFFIMTFSFRQAEGQIPGSLPKEGTGGVTAQSQLELPILITVRPMGRQRENVVYELKDYPHVIMTPKELGERLRYRARSGTEVPVIIKCRGDVQWRWVVEAFNQSVCAKFQNIGFDAS